MEKNKEKGSVGAMKKKQMRLHGIYTMLAFLCMAASLIVCGPVITRVLAAAGIVCILLCVYTGHKMLKG